MSAGGSGRTYDALVVGAGFAGINALHRLTQQGLRTVLVEAGDSVGGTWHWNRYPGARVDVESYEYSYDFSEELQQEWTWPERYAAQPDVLRYLDWVTDRLSLREHLRLSQRLTSLTFDEGSSTWSARLAPTDDAGIAIEGATGEGLAVRYVVLATGFLSAAQWPNIPGLREFGGQLVHTAAWPKEGLPTADQRVGVIGTSFERRAGRAGNRFRRAPTDGLSAHR